MDALVKFLGAMAQLQGQCRPRPRPEAWQYDSIEEFVLEHGRSYVWSPVPRGIRYGQKKACFMNASRLASRRDDLHYVEGFGMYPDGIPIHHAWCVTVEGLVIDTTWRIGEREPPSYFGVPFTLEQVLLNQLQTKMYGMYYVGSMTFMTWPRKNRKEDV